MALSKPDKLFIVAITLLAHLAFSLLNITEICLSVCLYVNQGDPNRNCYTSRLVILHGHLDRNMPDKPSRKINTPVKKLTP